MIGFGLSVPMRAPLGGPGLGEELVTDVGFDNAALWTLGTGWSISGGIATKIAGTNSFISLTGSTVVPGIYYQVTTVVTARTAGAALINIGNTDGVGRTAPGTYTETILATTSTTAGAAGGITIYGNGTFAGSYSSISVKRLS